MIAIRWVLPAVLCLAVSSAVAAPAPYNLVELGFTGQGYAFDSSGGLHQSSSVVNMNVAGDVAGTSARFDPTGLSLGSDAWLFTPSGGLQQIGLTGAGYNFTAAVPTPLFFGIGLIRTSSATAMNSSGQVAGVSSRYTETGPGLGQDAWFYDGSTSVVIGLTSGANAKLVAGGTYDHNYVKAVNNAGQIIGMAEEPTNGGQDAWIYSGGTTTQIGLAGANYIAPSGYRVSDVVAINDSGQAIGESYSFAGSNVNVGNDPWLYNGSTTVAIGLSGTDYSYVLSGVTTQTNQPPVAINAAGNVIGETLRYTADHATFLGQDAWIYNGGSTQIIGLLDSDHSYPAGGSTFRSSTVLGLNVSGQAIGYSLRYNSLGVDLGWDTWFFNGSSTQQIGLSGGVYSSPNPYGSGGVVQRSYPVALNNAGQVIGYSYRSNAGGYDAWFFDGSITHAIGFNGPGYSYVSGTVTTAGLNNVPLRLNASGQTIGVSSRYDAAGNSLGQDGWFYNPLTDSTALLRFSTNSDTGFSFTDPVLITDNGFVLGDYELFSGTTDLGDRVFVWNADTGVTPLDGLVGDQLSAEDWASLASVYDPSVPGALGARADGSPEFIVGTGYLDGQSTSMGGEFLPASQSVFLLTPTPEPASFALLAIGAVGFLSRRRK